MSTYAIVEISGTQFKVTPDEEILVPLTPGEAGKKLELEKVLFLADGETFSVGTPTVNGVKLTATIVSQEKGLKVNVFKYKAKSRYQKETGFRSKLTKIRIESFGTSPVAKEKETIKKVATKPSVKKTVAKK